MKMRLGFDAKRVFNNKSGLGNYGRNLLDSMILHYPDNEYYLFTPRTNIELYKPQQNQFIIEPNKAWRGFKSTWRIMCAAEDAKRLKIDIFHGLSNELPLNIRRSKVKSIVTIHDLIFLRYPNFYKKIDRLIYNKKFKSACLNADKIIAISRQTKQDIIDFYNIEPDKIDIVYQPINQNLFIDVDEKHKQELKQKYSLADEFLLYVGTIEDRKNILSILEALHYGNIDIPFVVVGRATSYIEKLKLFIKEKKLKNIIFLSNVSNNEIRSLYSCAKIMIYPSVFEGFGLPVAEAQACGTPVITSNISSLPEAGGDAAILVSPTSHEEISEAILKLLNDKSFYEDIKQASLENSKRFTYAEAAKNMYKIYESLL